MNCAPGVSSLQPPPPQRVSLTTLWALLRPYWFSEERWGARGLLALVVGLNLGGVCLAVLLALWNRQFFDALQVKDYSGIPRLLGRFGGLAALYIVAAVYALYFNQMLQIRWRRWLTGQYCRDWLAGRAYYLLQLEPSGRREPGAAHPGRHRDRRQPQPGPVDRRDQLRGDPGIVPGDAVDPVRTLPCTLRAMTWRSPAIWCGWPSCTRRWGRLPPTSSAGR